MGLFNVSPLDWITKVTNFSQTSLENTMDTIREVHQTLIEIPINVAQELGVPEEKATALKDTHRRILEHLHSGVCDACGEINHYIVKQAKTVNELANFESPAGGSRVVELISKAAGEK